MELVLIKNDFNFPINWNDFPSFLQLKQLLYSINICA